ncbi:MAG: glycoside hydrolase family 130 protein [Acidimicrobiales bacterium]|nr:glycoside hydrolase family 130 protein [Acidimicrobiales bacterium]
MSDDLAVRQPLRLRADSSRVITKLFVPGHPEVQRGRQVSEAVTHVLDLAEERVAAGLAELQSRFGPRHRNLSATFEHNADRLANRLPEGAVMSDQRRMLLGATFTHEYSVEAAALCNPSVVAAPVQTGPAGSLDLVLSTRGIGEGHRSSIGFRTASVDGDGQITVEAPGPYATVGTVSSGTLHADAFRSVARRASDDAEATTWVLDSLGDEFTQFELDDRLTELEGQGDTRPDVARTVRRLRALAARGYRVEFDASTPVDERVLYPVADAERNGIEDARFVRFEDTDSAVYYATYTAYDGRDIVQQLLETVDFSTFDASPLQGPAAQNKGLALFPRRIGGHFAALSRHNGTSNAVAFTDDIRHWPTATRLAGRTKLWSSIQVGNCGSPIETEAGWLMLTHGVGPMRTYSIGACLLDLDDPTRVIGELAEPLLSPGPDEQDGYVPNVVYSCGVVRHGPRLVIPYGIGDASIGFATADLDAILARMDRV